MRSVLVVSVGVILFSNMIQVLGEDPGGNKETEALPVPEKLLSHGGRYQESQYGQISEKEPEPVQNEGISSRKPRVNFVSRTRDNNNNNRDGSTREAKNLDVAESRDTKSVYPMPESRSFDLFHKNYQRPTYPTMGYPAYPPPMYDQGYQGNYIDRYGPPMSQRDYYDNRRTYQQDYVPPAMMPPPVQDPYYNVPYYPSNKMYDMPIEQRQPYAPAIPPVNQYPNPYYQGAHVPSVPIAGAPAAQPPSGYPPTEAPPLSPENRNKRIIYYTTLPEVVRTPPNVNLNYHYDRYRARSGLPYDTYYERYNNRYNTYGRWIPQPDY